VSKKTILTSFDGHTELAEVALPLASFKQEDEAGELLWQAQYDRLLLIMHTARKRFVGLVKQQAFLLTE
jgi:hypothetical protein